MHTDLRQREELHQTQFLVTSHWGATNFNVAQLVREVGELLSGQTCQHGPARRNKRKPCRLPFMDGREEFLRKHESVGKNYSTASEHLTTQATQAKRMI